MNDGYIVLPANSDYWDLVMKWYNYSGETRGWSELMGNVTCDFLTDFDGEWDFDKDGPLGIIEVKQDIK